MNGRRPWLALLGLCAAFELPSLVQPDRVTLAELRVPGDALLLAALALAVAHWRVTRDGHGRAARVARLTRLPGALLTACAAVLVVYRVDAAICLVLMRHPPVLYDQAFLLRHLAVLLSDLWGGWAWLGAAALIAVVGALAWLAHRLLREVARDALAPGARRRLATLVALACGALLLSATGASAVRWVAPELARNAIAARDMSRRIARGMERSPYRAYDAIALPRRPNLYVFFVESYGRVIASDPAMSESWRTTMRGLESELARAGYRFASAYSDAPISGGRSWLAHASLFTGTRVDFQALFQSLFRAGRAQIPHLPGFLRARGYRTVLLAPADRVRPGVRAENAYGYEQTVRFQQLNYRGPAFGWGRIPDQYSLAYAQDHLFARGDRPLFFVFTMVSSHAPWTEVPELVNDARDARAYAAMKQRAQTVAFTATKSAGTLIDQTRRFTRETRRHGDAAPSPSLRAAYARSIAYDFALLRDALSALRGDDLVLVMGDHQPPLVTGAHDDFAAPVHVIARDPALLAEFLDRGFAPGLVLAPHAKSALRHEGLFSLLVRTLVRSSGQRSGLPPYLPHGVGLAD